MSYPIANTGFDLDLANLDTALQGIGVDPIATGINDYLISLGDTRGVHDTRHLISGQVGQPPFAVSMVDILTPAGTTTVDTDSNPLLQVLVLDDSGEPPNQNVTVTGNHNILIATGNGTNTITLLDHGNDLVEGGSGSNTITGGFGSDSIYGAGSGDSLTASSGNHSVVYEGGSGGTLVGGSGHDDSLIVGAGSDNSLVAGANHTWLGIVGPGGGVGDSLNGGNFNAVTMQGGDGKGEFLTGSGNHDVLLTGGNKHEYLYGGGNNDSLYAGGAGDSGNGGGTLIGGGNDDQFHIGAHSNDTISGMGHNDTVYFDDQAYGTGAGITINTASNGVTSVSFASTGQHFTISGVQTLNFSDGHVVNL